MQVKDREPLVLKRSESYIGVMIDDLINKEIEEPYRLLTSRAEYRLLLRQDNADLRLTEKGRQIGLVDDNRWMAYQQKEEILEVESNELKFSSFTPADEEMAEFLSYKNTAAIRDRVSLWELLRRPELSIYDYVGKGWLRDNDPDILEQLEIQAKYEGYIEKQKEQVKRFEKLENKMLPPDLNYDEVYGLSQEAVQKLKIVLPASVGQASRIAGVNPADINVLLIFLEKKRRK